VQKEQQLEKNLRKSSAFRRIGGMCRKVFILKCNRQQCSR